MGPTLKCRRMCSYCRHNGHTMQFCHKLKNCDLCGNLGHNPKRCWRYHTIKEWMQRAEELSRCGECLTLFTADEENCTNCYTRRVYWKPIFGNNHVESQTDNIHLVKNFQTELQEKDTTIEKLNSKISSLENKLESSNATIDNLNWKLQCIIKEKGGKKKKKKKKKKS